MAETALKKYEMQMVIDCIYHSCGHDFSQYSQVSMQRLVENMRLEERLVHIAELVPKILHDQQFKQQLVDRLTISYSQLFRDPQLFQKLRTEVFPLLLSYPRISIWVAGCATGEEVYSLAIMLHEAGLLQRCQIYATDVSGAALRVASSGKLRFSVTPEDQQRYQASGGQRKLTDYFSAQQQYTLSETLLSQIIFERHDLIQQPEFISAQLVLCRNVFIYFERALQNRVLQLLIDSLTNGGYLAMGVEENIGFCDNFKKLEIVSRKAGLYKKNGL